jgi:hypothetical protein
MKSMLVKSKELASMATEIEDRSQSRTRFGKMGLAANLLRVV